jgi:hypothetical protein
MPALPPERFIDNRVLRAKMQPLDANSYQSSQDKPRKHSAEEVRPRTHQTINPRSTVVVPGLSG